MGEGREIRGVWIKCIRAHQGKPSSCPMQHESQELGLCSLSLPGAWE